VAIQNSRIVFLIMLQQYLDKLALLHIVHKVAQTQRLDIRTPDRAGQTVQRASHSRCSNRFCSGTLTLTSFRRRSIPLRLRFFCVSIVTQVLEAGARCDGGGGGGWEMGALNQLVLCTPRLEGDLLFWDRGAFDWSIAPQGKRHHPRTAYCLCSVILWRPRKMLAAKRSSNSSTIA
jgi:hypothetical protein